jgi:hypothetical protein
MYNSIESEWDGACTFDCVKDIFIYEHEYQFEIHFVSELFNVFGWYNW